MAQVVPIISVRSEKTRKHHAWASRSLTKRNPNGRSVAEVLADADAQGKMRVHISPDSKLLFERAAQLPGNDHLSEIARLGYVEVDLSSLKSHSGSDRVIVGFEVNWTEGESTALGLRDDNPGAPRVQSQA
jgi:hypothetical protein